MGIIRWRSKFGGHHLLIDYLSCLNASLHHLINNFNLYIPNGLIYIFYYIITSVQKVKKLSGDSQNKHINSEWSLRVRQNPRLFDNDFFLQNSLLPGLAYTASTYFIYLFNFIIFPSSFFNIQYCMLGREVE